MDFSRTTLGIELGSTRIKAVLIDEHHIPVASGDYEWENQLVNGVWTYSMRDASCSSTRRRPCAKPLPTVLCRSCCSALKHNACDIILHVLSQNGLLPVGAVI